MGKLRSGRRETVRPCINCYVCVEQNFFDATPRCAVNPALCHEGRTDRVTPPTTRHVVVVGGGPAGMETAIEARRPGAPGHPPREASDRLGGTAWFSQMTTPANGPFIEWQTGELARLGVDVRLGDRASAASVAALAPDAVVVATGTARGRPTLPGADLPHVQTGDGLRALITGEPHPDQTRAIRLLLRAGRILRLTTDAARVRALSKRWMPVGRHVVVLGGGLVGLELAEFLAERDRTVTVLEAGAAMGLPMASPRRWTAVRPGRGARRHPRPLGRGHPHHRDRSAVPNGRRTGRRLR